MTLLPPGWNLQPRASSCPTRFPVPGSRPNTPSRDGAPRVGDGSFAEELDARLAQGANWRVVNEGDLVPHVPPEPFFSHAGRRMLLLDNGRRSTSERQWTRFRRSIRGWIGAVAGEIRLETAGPHLLDSDRGYLRRLDAQAG